MSTLEHRLRVLPLSISYPGCRWRRDAKRRRMPIVITQRLSAAVRVVAIAGVDRSPPPLKNALLCISFQRMRLVVIIRSLLQYVDRRSRVFPRRHLFPTMVAVLPSAFYEPSFIGDGILGRTVRACEVGHIATTPRRRRSSNWQKSGSRSNLLPLLALLMLFN